MHQKRTDLAKKIKTEAVKLNSSPNISMTNIRMIERMMRKLEDLHEPLVYADIPRLLMVHPAIWLMETYRAAKNYLKMVKFSIEVLRNFGFGDKIVDAETNTVVLNFEGGLVNTEAFKSLRNAIEGYEAMGKSLLVEGCRVAARRMFAVLTGCDDGIEEFL